MFNRRKNEIVERKRAKKNRALFTLYVLTWFIIVIGMNQFLDMGFFILGCLFFFVVFTFNWLPLKKVKRIKLELFSFIVTDGKVSKEIQFNEVAFIDQNVVEGEKPYYESIAFLDSNFNELYKLNAKGFDYRELVVLCESIRQSNYEFGTNELEMNNFNKLLYDENTFEI